MDDTTQAPTPNTAPPLPLKSPNNAGIAGWTAGTVGVFCVIGLINAPTWPMAIGVAIIMGTISTICCCLLKKG